MPPPSPPADRSDGKQKQSRGCESQSQECTVLRPVHIERSLKGSKNDEGRSLHLALTRPNPNMPRTATSSLPTSVQKEAW
jgi:hypothetical protein